MKSPKRIGSQMFTMLCNTYSVVRGSYVACMEGIGDWLERRLLISPLTPYADNVPTTWYIVFHKSFAVPFWQWLYMLATPKEFGHMFCFSQIGPMVLFIDPTHSAVHISIKYDVEDINNPVYAEDYAQAFADNEGWTVIKVTHDPWNELNIRHLMNFIPSCVTLIKIVIGLPAPVLTPYAYYKFLIKSGKGEIIHGRTIGGEAESPRAISEST